MFYENHNLANTSSMITRKINETSLKKTSIFKYEIQNLNNQIYILKNHGKKVQPPK